MKDTAGNVFVIGVCLFLVVCCVLAAILLVIGRKQ